MWGRWRRLLLALGMAAASLAGGHARATDARPPKIPAADFAEQPLMASPLLSPDGEKVAGRFNQNGNVLLGIHFFADGKTNVFNLPKSIDLEGFRWAGNNRLLFSASTKVEIEGDEYRSTRLYCYDLATKSAKLVGMKGGGFNGSDLLYVDPAGTFILLSEAQSIFDWPDVWRFDLADDHATKLVPYRTGVYTWYADDKGVVRAGIGSTDTRALMLYRSNADEKFRVVDRSKHSDDLFSPESVRLLAFLSGTDEGYVLSNKTTGRYALSRFNYLTQQPGELVFQNDTNDVDDLDFSDDGNKLEAIHFTDDRPRIAWIDPGLKQVQADIDRVLPSQTNRIVSRSADNNTLIVFVGASNNPGNYYVYRQDEGRMHKLVAMSTKLDPAQLAPVQAVLYKARDGLMIPAYLTLPKGRPTRGLPLIIMPHGGPYGVRDTLQYDPDVQFLANRGYVVLQPNYRGSDSYGLEYHKKGEGEWGRKMQDDLDDGMDWLVSQGVVDPKRVCIVGSSYGGYAAAWGATRNPERYRCAASFAGVFDLRRQLHYTSDFLTSAEYKTWQKTVKGPEQFDLDSVSPLNKAASLTVPIMLVHGDADTRVPIKQSQLYDAALTKAGKPHEFYVLKGEGHGFDKPEDYAFFLNKLDAFLTKHNPAD